uniref:J domain-containing protein n=1 Tax=Homalodisca liturata TaxID=320908 RepID=A0A1B6HTT0_9HEMI
MNMHRKVMINVCRLRGTRVQLNQSVCLHSSCRKNLILERNIHWHVSSSVKVNFLDLNSLNKNPSNMLFGKIVSSIPSVMLYSTVINPIQLCWNCNDSVNSNSIFCDSCGVLQPVNRSADYFQIIGVDRSYRTDNTSLRQKYRSLQTLLHPDKFSSKPKKEQELSEEFSSVVNKAYSTLTDPLERGLYLLGLHHVSIEEGTTDVDKTFLMEIMERNEEIENETDPQKLKEFYTNNKDQLDGLISKVAEAFDSNNIEAAKKLLTKMKYYHSIETKIKEIKQKLSIPD